nr:immunoglobulin light chain junction region [Macaca mulatta]MPO04478.1 immunoglobulin light chain junction region [Macaca mulatta]MPO04646.1 immunoglobulin light chain junction region [Macaca mulatta]MPO04785.1 immunoglobulin light chain junction region [Macaca mulatta]MPO05882.1 immunoglobulin light chain junction region [Macaca mulatta]
CAAWDDSLTGYIF